MITAEVKPIYCERHGYRPFEHYCSLCSSVASTAVLSSWPKQAAPESFSLDTFLAEVKDSCTNHAERKGYTTAQNKDAGDVLGPCLTTLGIARDHSLGEIVAKIVEYRHTPRRVLAVKIAGWAWRLWLNTER